MPRTVAEIRALLAKHDDFNAGWCGCDNESTCLDAEDVRVVLAEIDHRDGMVCDTCASGVMHQNFGDAVALCCNDTRQTDDYGSDLMFPCATFGHTCGGWAPKGGA